MAATAFPAAAIVSGTIATARLGSGTADATSFLRGDSTWAVVPEVTRASLGLATTDSPTFAGATVGSGTVTAPSIAIGSSNDGFYVAANEISATIDGVRRWRVDEQSRIWQSASISSLYCQADGLGYFSRSNTAAYRLGENDDCNLFRDAANTWASRNGTNGQKSRLYKTYTSATSGEWLELDAATDASNFDIAASIGSAGGTARGIRIGGKNAAGTFTSWMSFATNGDATFARTITTTFKIATTNQVDSPFFKSTSTSGYFGVVNRWAAYGGGAEGTMLLTDWTTGATFDRIMLGGTTSSFPAIKRNATAINFRLADDSADAPITASDITASGTLQIGNAAVAETPVATHTLVIKDSTGTSYRVLAVAV